MGPHTTSDDPTRYQPAEELAAWRDRDPISRMRCYLRNVLRVLDDTGVRVRDLPLLSGVSKESISMAMGVCATY